MKVLSKIRKNGIKNSIVKFYRYKIDRIYIAFLNRFLRMKPLLNVIIIESHNDFDCNGGAFYDFLIENKINEKYKIVWFLKNKNKKKLPKNVKAYKIFSPSLLKAYYLCRAKFITFDCHSIRKVRKEQKVYYFGHGAISLKNVNGKLVVPDYVDYLLCPSKYFEPVFCSQTTIKYPDNRNIYLGYPSHDLLFKPSDEISKITKNGYKKVFLWMPTFRTGKKIDRVDSDLEYPYGVPLINKEEELFAINNFLIENNSLLIIKLHPVQDLSNIKQINYSNIIVLDKDTVKKYDIDNYRLLASCDALISDYSSVVYSYILLDRPIGFIFTDLENYKLGLVDVNLDEYLVGENISTFAEYLSFFGNVITEQDIYAKKRTDLKKKLYHYLDDNSCMRIAEHMGVYKNEK